jgi:hypothetical protein
MKAFNNAAENRSAAWPHPSLGGEVGRPRGRPDEHEQTDILTPGFILASAFPRFRSGCWKFVARHSGATVAESHGVPCHLFVFKTELSKNAQSKATRGKICKRQFGDATQTQAGARKYFSQTVRRGKFKPPPFAVYYFCR